MKKHKVVMFTCPDSTCRTVITEEQAKRLREQEAQKRTVQERLLSDENPTNVPCPKCRKNMVRRVKETKG